jgi:hypothetical protein
LGAIRECRRNLELIARLSGELEPHAAGEGGGHGLIVQVNYVSTKPIAGGFLGLYMRTSVIFSFDFSEAAHLAYSRAPFHFCGVNSQSIAACIHSRQYAFELYRSPSIETYSDSSAPTVRGRSGTALLAYQRCWASETVVLTTRDKTG